MGPILELQFKNALGATRTLRINQPKLGLSVADVQEAQAALVEAEAFQQDDVDMYVQPTGARYVERVVDDLYQTD